MKTSNKLLIGFLLATFLIISVVVGYAKHYENKSSDNDGEKTSKEYNWDF
ncbi:MAG: hypothetical protein M3Q58_11220 [Bacteroidota bacterium]|nr:hypothetical protein [Bacteroidota bacterium]